MPDPRSSSPPRPRSQASNQADHEFSVTFCLSQHSETRAAHIERLLLTRIVIAVFNALSLCTVTVTQVYDCEVCPHIWS